MIKIFTIYVSSICEEKCLLNYNRDVISCPLKKPFDIKKQTINFDKKNSLLD